jgi:hypothetical protein
MEGANGQQPQQPTDLASAIKSALDLRRVKPRCSECGHVGFEHFACAPNPAAVSLAAEGHVLLCAALVCRRCGATKLYNLNVLGLRVEREERRIVTPGQGQPQQLIVPV